MDKLELFNNLMILAASDGKLTEEEIAFLSVRANDLGLSEDDVETAIAGATSDEVELVLPTDGPERVEVLQQMITLMAVDGEMAEVEKGICALAAGAMGFDAAEFDKVIDSLI